MKEEYCERITRGGASLITYSGCYDEASCDNFGCEHIGSKHDTNELKQFYIDSYTSNRALSERANGSRQILNQRAFNIIFKPDVKIPENATNTLELGFEGLSGDIYLDKELIMPKLDNYIPIKDFEDTNEQVYIREDLFEYTTQIKYEDVEDANSFIVKNFQGSVVYSQSPIILTNPEIEDYERIDTSINATFRDNLVLAVYGQSLIIKFTKQDLNWYEGEDTYTLILRDINKNILYNQTFEDDGNSINNSKIGIEQDFEVNLREFTREKGVYFAEFLIERNNIAPDAVIKDVKVNTNKVTIFGNFLPWSPIKLYISVIKPKEIIFYYWWGGKNQEIQLYNNKFEGIIDLNESYREENYYHDIVPGNYTFDVEKGYAWIKSKLNFAPSDDSWFTLPLIVQETKNNPEFIVIDKSMSEVDGFDIKLTKRVELTDIENVFEIQIKDITENSTIMFKTARIEVK